MDDPRRSLRADCANCFALCCVALPFARSADFAFDKPAGRPCRNLLADHRCGIHDRLREQGFRGCTVFDCFGAGQRVSQETFGGTAPRTDPRTTWRTDPATARAMAEAFPVVRHLHELLWYLAEAVAHPAAEPLREELAAAYRRVDDLAGSGPAELAEVGVDALRQEIGALLLRVSERARAEIRKSPDHRGADLMGAKLGGADLRGASLRGALLIAADLRSADLRLADLLGADVRDADLRGADLTGALFLTQPQVVAARGDAGTRLPGRLSVPAHWRTGR